MIRAALVALLVSGFTQAADWQQYIDELSTCETEKCFLQIKSRIDKKALSEGKTRKELKAAWLASSYYTTPPANDAEAQAWCGAGRGNPDGYPCALEVYISRLAN